MIVTRSTRRLGPFLQWKVTDGERTPHELMDWAVRLSNLSLSLFLSFLFWGKKKNQEKKNILFLIRGTQNMDEIVRTRGWGRSYIYSYFPLFELLCLLCLVFGSN